MAKADGQVTRDEVSAFREVFHIPENALEQAARVFNLARQDVSGFELYARNIARMFGAGDRSFTICSKGYFISLRPMGNTIPTKMPSWKRLLMNLA